MEWKRSVGQWLCLLAATYWNDAYQHKGMLGSRADDSAEFRALFWKRWSRLNRSHRLHELIEGIEEALLEKLDPSTRLQNSFELALQQWREDSANGWRNIRNSILETMQVLCTHEKLTAKLYDRYYIGGPGRASVPPSGTNSKRSGRRRYE